MEGAAATFPGWTSSLPLIADAIGWQPIIQGIGSTDVANDAGRGAGTNGIARLQADVVDLEPDAVLVFYGLNSTNIGITPDQYTGQCTTFLKQLRNGLPSVPAYWAGISPTRTVSAQALAPWNAAIKAAVATVPRCTFIPVPDWDTATAISDDTTHPTDAGYRILADTCLAVMRPALS